MSARAKLKLDHFYLCVPENQFPDLVPLAQIIRGAEHLVIKTPDATWEGVYIYDASGLYLEIMGRNRGASFGIATSCYPPQYGNASRLADEMPWLNWTKDLMRHHDGQPWFEWLASSDPRDNPVEAWTMRYFAAHTDRVRPHVRPDIRNFQSLRLRCDSDKFGQIRRACEWLPGTQLFGRDAIVLEIPKPHGGFFRVEIEASPGDKLELESLEFELESDVSLPPTQMGAFELRQRGLRGTFRRVD